MEQRETTWKDLEQLGKRPNQIDDEIERDWMKLDKIGLDWMRLNQIERA